MIYEMRMFNTKLEEAIKQTINGDVYVSMPTEDQLMIDICDKGINYRLNFDNVDYSICNSTLVEPIVNHVVVALKTMKHNK